MIGRDIKDERGGYSRVAIIAKTIENYNTMVKKVYFEGMAQIAIGKDPSNNVIYMNALVSSHHAKIIFRDNDYYILDSSSVNGIYVNGIICRKSILKSGDTIVIGGFKIVFHSAYLALFHSGKRASC